MQADVVHGAVGTVYVGDADGFLAAGEFFGFVGWGEFGLGGELGECRHGLWRVRAELRSADGSKTRPHTSLFWLQCLRDHYLALEVFQHVGIEANFGWSLRQRHGVDLVLELEQSVEKIFGARRAAGDVNIRGDDLVYA